MILIRNNLKFVRLATNPRFLSTSLIIYSNKEVSNDAAVYKFNKTNLPIVVKPGFFDKIKESLGFQGGLRYPPPILTQAALRLYLCIQYQIDYDRMYKKCDMPDVMQSFCLITFLHVWLLSVALMQHGRTGLYVRKTLHQVMWKDIETREKKLKAPMNSKNKLKTYTHLNDVFRGFLFGFDEGLLGDDIELAGAIWRHLFQMKEINNYADIGEFCDYIRKNVVHLESINEIDILKLGIVSFVDLDQEKLDHSKIRIKILEKIKQKETDA
jgi:hypothetical protein